MEWPLSSASPVSRQRIALVVLAIAAVTISLAATRRVVITGAQGRQVSTIRSSVDLVRLGVTARNGLGHIVHDLRREDFAVYDDGVVQELSHFAQHESPISVVVLLDRSSSMHGDKMMHAVDGIEALLKALRPHDEALLISFGSTVEALGGFGLDAPTIVRELKRVDAGGSTRLYDAVVEAARLISARERHEKRAILILSDGADTLSTATLEDAAVAVKRAGVPVYAIGIEFGQDVYSQRTVPDAAWRRLEGDGGVTGLTRLAEGTGGWAYPVEAARRCKEVCLRVADELRNQYLLGYYPADLERDGRWREIAVRTSREGVKLATRPGYFAPGS